MKRWSITLLLGGLALGAAWVAPFLVGAPTGSPGPSAQTIPKADGTAVRPTDNVVVVLDVSGSMSLRSRMDHARDAMRALHRALHPNHDFALVVFNDEATLVIPADLVPGAAADALIDSIHDFGGTNLYGGLTLGARALERMRAPGEAGHLVVISDGVANVGAIEPATFERLARALHRDGVVVSAVGLGSDVDRTTLERLAHHTRGVTAMLDDAAGLRQWLLETYPHDAVIEMATTPAEVSGDR